MTADTDAPPDPVIVVQGTERQYICGTLDELDAHLADLTNRVTLAARRFPKLARAYRADQDRLLDRRTWLTLPTREEHS